MPDDAPLTTATRDDLISALAHGLLFDRSGKAHRKAAELTARIAAEALAGYLEQAGFVVMKRPDAKPHSTPRSG